MRCPREIRDQLNKDPNAVITPELFKKYPKLHWCYDWDMLLIDEGDVEFNYCNCVFEEELCETK